MTEEELEKELERYAKIGAQVQRKVEMEELFDVERERKIQDYIATHREDMKYPHI